MKVIVVGGGPAGLLLSLMLGQKGISVQLLEASHKLDEQPRATHYGAPAVYELRRAGVLDDIARQGFSPNLVCWRKLDGTFLAGLDGSFLDGHGDRVICLPLDKVGKIIYNHLQTVLSVEICWSYRVKSVRQDDGSATVEIETADGTRTLQADYVVGCDGANSQVRRSLFGDRSFPGKTWDEQVVATNTYYDFEKFGWADANFIIHPAHWFMAARISNDGLWRVSYGELPGLTRDELLARQPVKFEQMLPGNPKPGEYKLAAISPYKVHQRLAPSMRVGRVLLAADAAHLCNPFGGLGLTGGIVDVGGLSDCLVGIFEGKTDASILDKYNEVRREKYSTMIDPISSANIRLLFDQNPDTALEDSEFLKMCKKAEGNADLSRQLQMGTNALRYDFSQDFKLPSDLGEVEVP